MSDYSKYLNTIRMSYELNRIKSTVTKYNKARERIVKALPREWKKYSPINAGSMEKKTAVNTRFDYDLIIPLERNKFDQIEQMLGELYSFFQTALNKKEIQGLTGVRRQSVSVGLHFGITDKDYDFDIVPGFELYQGDYPKTHNLYLYPHRNDNPELIKTNVKKQLEHFRNKRTPPQALHVIQLLKIWKYKDKSITVKSFLLELMVIKAFRLIEENAKLKMPANLWEQLRYAIGYIEKSIENTRILDPGNRDNNVSDSMTTTEKAVFAKKLRKLIVKLDDECKTGEKTTLKKNFPRSTYG